MVVLVNMTPSIGVGRAVVTRKVWLSPEVLLVEFTDTSVPEKVHEHPTKNILEIPYQDYTPRRTASKCLQQLPTTEGNHLIRLPLEIDDINRFFGSADYLSICFESLIALAIRGGCALLEHPAEPQRQVATIWKLCVTALLEKIPGFKRHRVHQGNLGSESCKPTDLFALHLETLPQDLKDHHLGGPHGFAASIGKSADGTFKTARLKEYPPAMNLALATSVTKAISKLSCVETSQHLPFETAVELQQLVIYEYGVSYGPDFHG